MYPVVKRCVGLNGSEDEQQEREASSAKALYLTCGIVTAAFSADDVDTGIIGEVGVGRKAALVGKLSIHSGFWSGIFA